MAIPLDADRVKARYHNVRNELPVRFPDGRVLGTGTSTTPFDPSYPRGEIFMGSHMDMDSATEDRIEVWSSKPNPAGFGEQILQEIFVERMERPGLFSSKVPTLHCFTVLLQTGGNILDVALMSINLQTGEVLRHEEGQEASRLIRKLGIGEDSRPYQHNPASMPPRWVPEPRIPLAEDLEAEQRRLEEEHRKARGEVEQLASGVTGQAGGGKVSEQGDHVVVGHVVLPRREEPPQAGQNASTHVK